MRNRFDEQLGMLKKKMIEMSAICEEMIAKASHALLNGDADLAGQVVTDGEGIGRSEREIESLCVKLLLQQQPVAGDLRQISAALKMVTDIERIGDQAEDIAEIIPFLKGEEFENSSLIRKMAEAAIQMVNRSIDAYVSQNAELARDVIRQDDIVDGLFLEMKKLLIRMISETPGRGEFALDILMISKYFERIGDHAVNIAEWVIYSVTGELKGEAE